MSEFIHLVMFRKPTGSEADAANTRGDIPLTYADDFLAYVKIDPLVGRELLAAREQRGDLTHKVAMQTDSRMNHRSIFVWNGRTFNCGPRITENERERYSEFYAGEILG